MVTYIALLRKEKDSDFGVDFPDFPGCITVGTTLEEAHKRAAEALRFHIKGMMEDAEPIPEPSSLDEIMADAANISAVPFLVTVPDTKTKRINITIPERTWNPSTTMQGGTKCLDRPFCWRRRRRL